MAGVNKVILLGNLGADPEVRHLESGSVVANISIATSEVYTKNGQRMEQTEWHKVELWDRLAELCEKYLSKGNTVYIEGKIRTNTYQDKEGVTRYDKRIRATNMTFVGGRNEDTDTADSNSYSQGGMPSQPSAPTQKREEAMPQHNEQDTDDLPF
ncbi:single-strand DNA-binding protein [Catalinimonas alkaloidigena]|uniref:single-stranded DNA-binding protein n=1 Tax=Catalinimonas alkaloidigena TaxID=1075417 RepID=UPI002406B769|nr:single-stranded DNA-binding protein [Catalinimonas alkaloidigena]MDF9800920.1 single-strand DNA-binding protein [Catalinimonas alkaloidigena]